MSLINDALIKAERDRAEEAAARAAGFVVHPQFRAEKRRRSRQLQSVPLAIVNAAALLACFAIVILVVLRNRPAESADATATRPSAADTAAPSAFAASAPSLPASDSSATPPPAALAPLPDSVDTPAVASAPPPPADYELVGMSAVGDNTLLSINRRSDQRSVWIPVGKSVGEITAVSYDPASDRAVIRVQGRELTLGLRTGAIAAAE